MVVANFPDVAGTALVKLIGGSQPRSRLALCTAPSLPLLTFSQEILRTVSELIVSIEESRICWR